MRSMLTGRIISIAAASWLFASNPASACMDCNPCYGPAEVEAVEEAPESDTPRWAAGATALELADDAAARAAQRPYESWRPWWIGPPSPGSDWVDTVQGVPAAAPVAGNANAKAPGAGGPAGAPADQPSATIYHPDGSTVTAKGKPKGGHDVTRTDGTGKVTSTDAHGDGVGHGQGDFVSTTDKNGKRRTVRKPKKAGKLPSASSTDRQGNTTTVRRLPGGGREVTTTNGRGQVTSRQTY